VIAFENFLKIAPNLFESPFFALPPFTLFSFCLAPLRVLSHDLEQHSVKLRSMFCDFFA